MQAAIASARAIVQASFARYGELADIYEAMASILAWNTMFTPIEGVITPVSRGWDFGAGYVIFDWDNLFLAFMASVDQVPVSLFLSSARTDMLPIRMWGMMESTLDVRVAAVSGLLILAAFLLMLVMERLTGLTRRIRG
jgi:hypothetical protein